MVRRKSEGRAIPTIAELRHIAAAVGQEANCRLLILFGSAARAAADSPEDLGTARPPNDLDIAVAAEAGLDIVALTNRLIQTLGIQEVDVADLRHADPLLMMLVARDGIPLYEREPGAFNRFASLAVRRYADTRKFRDMEAQEIRDRIAAGRTAS